MEVGVGVCSPERIDDIVLRQVQAGLDIEEVRFSRTDPVD